MTKYIRTLLPGLFCLMLLGTVARAQNQADTKYMNEIRPERLVTPHEAFAKPYAPGKPKVLFLTMLNRGASREVAELHQRFGMEFGAVTTFGWRGTTLGTTSMFAPKKNTGPLDKKKELLAELEKDYDLVVIGKGLNLNKALSAKAKYMLFDKVRNGMGLMVVADSRGSLTHKRRGILPEQAVRKPLDLDPEQVLAGVPFPLIKSYRQDRGRGRPEKMFDAFQFGKGRIVGLYVNGPGKEGYRNRHSLTPLFYYNHREHTYYKYYLSVAAKALVVAAGIEPSITPAADNPRMVTVEQAALPAKIDAGTVTVPEGMKGALKIRLRSLLHPTRELPEHRFGPGEHALSFRVPQLPQGDYFIDYRFVTDAGVDYWGSVGVAVRNAPAHIAKLRLSKTYYNPDEAAAARVTVSKLLPDLALELSVFDIDGREVVRQRMPIKQLQDQAAVPLHNARLMPHHLIVRLVQGDQVLDVKRKDFAVMQPLPDFYSHTACPIQSGIIGYITARQLRRAGFHGSYDGRSDEGVILPQTGLHESLWAPNNLRIKPPSEKEPQATYADPRYVESNALDRALPSAEKNGERIDTYILGDEQGVTYTRPQVADAERDAWREFLRKTYSGNLELLNKEFGSEYNSFDEIPVPDYNELGKADAVRKHLWMHFVEKLFADTLHYVGERLVSADRDRKPEPYGLSGTTMPDMDMLNGFKLWTSYPNRTQNVAMRSFMSNDAIRANWWGGYMHSRRLGDRPIWDLLFKGGVNGSYYWSHGAEGIMSAERSYAEFFLDGQFSSMEEIHHRIGPLLRGSRVAATGFGTYYSKMNEHIHSLDVRFGTPGASRDAVISFSEKLGIPVWLHSDRSMTEQESLKRRNTRILFLGQAEAMPGKLRKELETWVEKGGTLVADVRTATRNDRGAPNGSGAMDAFFGIEQGADGEQRELAFPLPGHPDLVVENMIVDASVKATSGTPEATVDGVPILIRKQHGKGRTIFLNLALGRLLNNYADEPAVRAFMRKLLGAAGVDIGVETPQDYLVTQFDGQGYGLLACRIRGRAKPGEIVKLGRSYHAYALRGEVGYIGEVDQLTPSTHGGKESLFTLTKQPIGSFAVKGPAAVTPGEVAGVDITSETGETLADARRLFRVRMLRPGGGDGDYLWRLDAKPAHIPALETLKWTAGEPLHIGLPIAHNREPGEYTLEVTDLLSGERQTRTLKVQK